jgi:predicted RND superfamily exporter protein
MHTDTTSGPALRQFMRLSTARPALTIVVCLLVAAGSLLYTARALTFETSSIRLLPPNRLYVQRFQENLKEFGELNDIVVVVEAPSVERAQVYADRLAVEIKALPEAGRPRCPIGVPREASASRPHDATTPDYGVISGALQLAFALREWT